MGSRERVGNMGRESQDLIRRVRCLGKPSFETGDSRDTRVFFWKPMNWLALDRIAASFCGTWHGKVCLAVLSGMVSLSTRTRSSMKCTRYKPHTHGLMLTHLQFPLKTTRIYI